MAMTTETGVDNEIVEQGFAEIGAWIEGDACLSPQAEMSVSRLHRLKRTEMRGKLRRLDVNQVRLHVLDDAIANIRR
jgi:hypothetical protein